MTSLAKMEYRNPKRICHLQWFRYPTKFDEV